MKKGLLVFLLFFSVTFSFGQTRIANRLTNYWIDLNPNYKFSEKLYLRGDLGFRWNEDIDRQLYIVRPVVAWFPNSTFSYRFGASMFYNNEFYLEDDIELRLHQSMIIRWPKFIGWDMSHRFMIEERWIYDSFTDVFGFIVRSRYRLRIVSPDFRLFGIPNKFYIPVSVEFLLNLNSPEVLTEAYQDRLTAGLGNRLSKHIRLEFHYQSHGSRIILGDGFDVDEDVWRLRMFYLINPD